MQGKSGPSLGKTISGNLLVNESSMRLADICKEMEIGSGNTYCRNKKIYEYT